MKKALLCILLIFVLLGSFAFAEDSIRVGTLQGPTGMGMIQMMTDGDAEFTVAASADEIVPLLVQKKLDVAAVPANLAAVLYANTSGAVRTLAINTLGVLYIAERGDSVHSVEDLRGRTLYTAGKGATPEYALNYVLRGNGLEPGEDVTIEFKSEHAECLAALLSDENAVAMLPQPFLTVAQGKAPDVRTALDLTEEWNLLQEGSESPSTMITGVVIVRTEYLEEHPEQIAEFMDRYAESVSFVQSQPSEAAQQMGELDLFDASIAEKALPYCNITLISGEEMHSLLSGYLAVLYAQDPASVGGTLPDEAFYCVD